MGQEHGHTLVLNVGSSSLKAALFTADGGAEADHPRQLWHGTTSLASQRALAGQLEHWLVPALGEQWPRLQRVGHRVVHGGEHFNAPTALTPAVLQQLEALQPLAPLHNPPALAAIQWLLRLRPELEQWACFDTAFHASLPPAAYSYALPAAWRANGLRRYGFHGLSHQHLAERAAAHWRAQGRSGLPRLISCHLGAGCSLAAIAEGSSRDTTMGFTPLDGLVMARRSGSVDPGLLLHLQRLGLSLDDLEQGLNQGSGLLGLSGLSADWLELKTAAASGHEGARLALDVFRHRLLAGIGAMAASLGGVDLIGLTGGIGSHDMELLEDLQQALAWLGPLQWLQLEADEESMIAGLISDRGGRASGEAAGSVADDRR